MKTNKARGPRRNTPAPPPGITGKRTTTKKTKKKSGKKPSPPRTSSPMSDGDRDELRARWPLYWESNGSSKETVEVGPFRINIAHSSAAKPWGGSVLWPERTSGSGKVTVLVSVQTATLPELIDALRYGMGEKLEQWSGIFL